MSPYNKTWTDEDWTADGRSGTSFPASPYDGQPFYRTDHGYGYHYDTTASGWLSDCVFEIIYGVQVDIASGNPLKFGETLTNRTFDTVLGYNYGFAVKCVGLAVTMANSGTCDIEILDGATPVGASARLSISGAASGATEALMSTTIAAGNIIAVGCTSGTVEGPARGVARFRRIET